MSFLIVLDHFINRENHREGSYERHVANLKQLDKRKSFYRTLNILSTTNLRTLTTSLHEEEQKEACCTTSEIHTKNVTLCVVATTIWAEEINMLVYSSDEPKE